MSCHGGRLYERLYELLDPDLIAKLLGLTMHYHKSFVRTINYGGYVYLSDGERIYLSNTVATYIFRRQLVGFMIFYKPVDGVVNIICDSYGDNALFYIGMIEWCGAKKYNVTHISIDDIKKLDFREPYKKDDNDSDSDDE